MRVTEHIPDRLGSLADMAASAIGVVQTKIPMCPPPCECADCQTYYYTLEEQRFDRFHYTEVLTDDQARALLAHDLKDITSAQEYLRQSVTQHGDGIVEHWRKRTQQKRSALLQIAEPGLPEKKGEHARVQYAGTPWAEGRTSSAYRKYLLLPYLDIETLVKNPAVLIGLIRTRASDSPAEWAPFDHEQLRSPWGSGLLNTSFNAGAVVMFGPRYGTLSKWQKDAAHRFDIVGFPRGKLVMEAQATLMTFLRRVVEQLLVGIQLDRLHVTGDNSKWKTTIDSGLKMAGDTAAWSKFVQTPFTAPPRFDIDALVDLTKARVAATGDHLSLLQTEAAYFKRYIRKLHQMQTVESVRQKHAAFTIINWEITEDINIHWFWRGVLLEFEHLQNVYHRCRDSVAPGAALPKEVDRALGAVELVLVNAIHERSQQLQAMISQRPGFRDNYEHDGVKLDSRGVYESAIRFKKFAEDEDEGNAIIYKTQRLWWILMQLQGEPDSQTRFRYAMLLDMLDDHLATSPSSERTRLDEILYEKLSDYATLLELVWSARMHCPRNSIGTTMSCERTEDRLIWRAAKNNKVPSVPETSTMVKALKIFHASKTPAGPQNRGWLQQFKTMHDALQAFWKETSVSYRATYKKSRMSEEDIEYSMRPLQSWDDPEHIERLTQKQKVIEASWQKSKVIEGEGVFLPLPTPSATSAKVDSVQQVKTKAKTRGTPRAEESTEAACAAEEADVSARIIQLSKSSYTTLRSMFPSTVEERQKTINWTAFVNSMTDAGFTPRNGGGSIVRFENRKGVGSINFHRPHPEPIIDAVMLQAMGWRMNKWFGWVCETFVLVKK
jgi:hypothetical protein